MQISTYKKADWYNQVVDVYDPKNEKILGIKSTDTNNNETDKYIFCG